MVKEKKIGYSLKEVRDGAIYLYKFEPEYNMYEREEKEDPVTGKREWKRDEKGNKIYTPWFKETLESYIAEKKDKGIILTEKEAIKQMDRRVKWKWTSCGRWNQKKSEIKNQIQLEAYQKVQIEKDAMSLVTFNRLNEEALQLEYIYEYDKTVAQIYAERKNTLFRDELKKIREEAKTRLKSLQYSLGYTDGNEAFRKERFEEARKFFKELEQKKSV
jgi:hypothetical protein